MRNTAYDMYYHESLVVIRTLYNNNKYHYLLMITTDSNDYSYSIEISQNDKQQQLLNILLFIISTHTNC